MKKGWIYALFSPNCPHIKIGLTTTSPAQRIREINASKNYGPLGPWTQLDIRQVNDTSTIEKTLHKHLSENRVAVSGTSELFEITKIQARATLDTIPDADLSRAVPVNKLKLQSDFCNYLITLFQVSGLENFRQIEESWTFSIFPSTAGGRYFTLNIDRHEVAYSQPFKDEDSLVFHKIVVDDLIRRDKETKKWLKQNHGTWRRSIYPSNWGNATDIEFAATFDDCLALFQLTGFRRALIAYWYEALLRMQQKQTRSLHAKHHNHQAVSEIFAHLSEMRDFRNRSG